MTGEPQAVTGQEPQLATGPGPLARARLVFAWLITFGAVLYAWARVFVFGRISGRPELLYLLLLAGGLLAVLLLTLGLSASFTGRRFGLRLLLWVGVPWAAANALLVGLYTGSGLPLPVVMLLFIPATFGVVWLAWLFLIPLRWSVRFGVLALLVGACAASTLMTRISLAGDNQLEFAWRWNLAAADAVIAVPAGTVDLARISTEDYAQYLGPERNGVVRRAQLARDWSKQPPRLLWRKPVGAGWGAFAVAGGFAITQEQRGPDECVVCYRLTDGAVAWIHKDSADYESSLGGPGPRATPTIHGNRVYTVGATGILNCLEGGTGQALWTVNINDNAQATRLAEHGVCGSPLVVDDRVVVCPTGANGTSLAAYQCRTGKPVWAAGRDQASYGSPLLATFADVRQILLTTSKGITAHDVASGQILWSFPWTNDQSVNCSQPIPHVGEADEVFFSTGYGKGCVFFKVERAADGTWSVRDSPRESRQMKTKFTTPVYHQGYIYGLDDGILECLDPKKPRKEVWKDGRYQHGQILLAGDLLLVQTERGPLALVEPSPDGLQELGRIPALSGKTWNNPALAGKYLLVRNDCEAACYELPLDGQ